MKLETVRLPAFGDRDLVTGEIPKGIHAGKTFVLPARLAERYDVRDFFTAGGCGILFKGRDTHTENDVLIKGILYDGPGSKLLSFLAAGDRAGTSKFIIGERRKLELERRIAVWLKNAGVNAIPNPNDFVFDANPFFARTHTLDEGRGTWTIDEPAIIREEPYLVMEWVDGEQLQSWVESRRPADELRIITVAIELCRILEVVHRPFTIAGEGGARRTVTLVYQDLKPENVMIGEADYVCLLDFGGCRVTVDGAEQSAGAFTAGYKAPECDGVRPVRASADIYTVGSTLVALLIGHALSEFASRESQDASVDVAPQDGTIAVRQVGRDPKAYSPKCSPGLLHIIKKAMAKDPDERHASATELARDLEACRLRVRFSRSHR
jgi:serine/threonine protein kinase